MNILAIAIFGAIGGLLRLILENVVAAPNGFPLSTLIINLSGSLVLGYFLVMAERKEFREWFKLGIGVGLIGAFTTFSSFSIDIIHLIQTSIMFTLVYVIGSILGGILCAFAGEMAASWMFGAQTITESAEAQEVYP